MAGEIIICAPGAGLGHLVRACALFAELRKNGAAARIVTNSMYAEAMARLTGHHIERVPNREWAFAAPGLIGELKPAAVVADSFPFGIRGELARTASEVGGQRTRFIYLARRLKVGAYLERQGLAWDRRSPLLRNVVALEPLTASHEALIEGSGSDVFRLSARVRLEPDFEHAPPPAELLEALDAAGGRVAIHSGPRHETEALLARAREADPSAPTPAVVSPRYRAHDGRPAFEYFPASALLPLASEVICGGGYNMVAETGASAVKTVYYGFERLYDDQAGRIADGFRPPGNGAAEAAAYILSLL